MYLLCDPHVDAQLINDQVLRGLSFWSLGPM